MDRDKDLILDKWNPTSPICIVCAGVNFKSICMAQKDREIVTIKDCMICGHQYVEAYTLSNLTVVKPDGKYDPIKDEADMKLEGEKRK